MLLSSATNVRFLLTPNIPKSCESRPGDGEGYPSPRCLQESAPHRKGCRRRAPAVADLVVDVRDVAVHGRDTEVQLRGDLLARPASCEQPQYLQFGPGEPRRIALARLVLWSHQFDRPSLG